MKRLLWANVVVLGFYVCASAQYVKVLGVAQKSGSAVVSGISSTNKPSITFPLSTITIYNAGTTTPASIYSNSTGTVKANPFTAGSDASYDFFISPSSLFDVRVSGISNGVTISPFTRAGYTAPGTAGTSLALCTGTTDSALLTAVLATIPSAGGTIQIPSGSICAIDTKLTVSKSNITWAGYGVTLRFGGTAGTTRLLDLTGDNNTFQGLTFSANNGQPLGALIYVDDNVDNPKFIDCTFRDMSITIHGGVMLNQTYAVAVSPYGVTNFIFRNCLFYNLTNTNLTPVSGEGFVGGINFAKFNPNDSLNDLQAPQTVITSGVVEGCTFDTIKTILPTGLSENDVSLYDDADAIRASGGDPTFGYQGVGANQINVKVSNCQFINVSKRAIKFSAVSGLTVSNIEVIANKGAYSMTEVIKLYGNSTINGLKILSPGYNGTLTRSGSTVTATFTNHGFTTGDRISVFGATEQEYNGLWTVTVTGANTFTYTLVGTPTTPATGTIRAGRVPRTGISLMTLQNVNISDVVMDAGGAFLSFNDTTGTGVAQRNVVINGFACDNLDFGGITSSTDLNATAYALTIANGYLGCTGNTAKGIETPATVGNQGQFRIYNVEVRNGDVKIQGADNIVDGLLITIDRSGFQGSVANRSLLELGTIPVVVPTNYNIFRNIHVDVQSILSTYLSAPRTALVTISGDHTKAQNLSVNIADSVSLSTALPHVDFYGNYLTLEGLDYYGPGSVQLGTTVASNGAVYKNPSRLGTGAASTPFLISGANATNYVIRGVVDERAWAGNTFTLAGTPCVIDGVATLTSQYELGGNDSACTIKNATRISTILRREVTTTVSANSVSFAVLAGIVNLATSGGAHTGNTLAAPTTSDLSLVIVAAGPNSVGIVAGSTAIFVGAAPTVGTASGNIGTISFRSNSAGQWQETGRVLVP